jgi:hypothetical protein
MVADSLDIDRMEPFPIHIDGFVFGRPHHPDVRAVYTTVDAGESGDLVEVFGAF